MYRIEAAGDKIHYIDDEEKRDAFSAYGEFHGDVRNRKSSVH